MRRSCLRITGIGALVACVLLGQGSDPGRNTRLHGEISPLPPGLRELTVELSTNGAGLSTRTTVNLDGSFDLASVQPGLHELRVFDGGVMIHQETVMIRDSNQWL